MTAPANWMPQMISLFSGLVQAGTSFVKANRNSAEQTFEQPSAAAPAGALPTLRDLPSLPNLQALPSIPGGMPARTLPTFAAVAAASPAAAPAPPGDVAGSYAEEIEDLSIACVPCTRSHVSTMAVAAEVGASLAACDERGARVQFARVVGEAVIMEALDWTPDKMSRARTADRAAIEELMPQLRSLVARTPAAPRHVVLAWASVDEALRFARSPRATAADRQQVLVRIRLAEDCMNYSERMILAPEALATLLAALPESQHPEARLAGPTMREARHRLVSSQYELTDVEFISAKLEQAAMALTPPLDPHTAGELAKEYRALRDAFDLRILANMRQQAQVNGAGVVPKGDAQ